MLKDEVKLSITQLIDNQQNISNQSFKQLCRYGLNMEGLSPRQSVRQAQGDGRLEVRESNRSLRNRGMLLTSKG